MQNKKFLPTTHSRFGAVFLGRKLDILTSKRVGPVRPGELIFLNYVTSSCTGFVDF